MHDRLVLYQIVGVALNLAAVCNTRLSLHLQLQIRVLKGTLLWVIFTHYKPLLTAILFFTLSLFTGIIKYNKTSWKNLYSLKVQAFIRRALSSSL